MRIPQRQAVWILQAFVDVQFIDEGIVEPVAEIAVCAHDEIGDVDGAASIGRDICADALYPVHVTGHLPVAIKIDDHEMPFAVNRRDAIQIAPAASLSGEVDAEAIVEVSHGEALIGSG